MNAEIGEYHPGWYSWSSDIVESPYILCQFGQLEKDDKVSLRASSFWYVL